MCQGMCVEVNEQLVGIRFFFYQVNPRDHHTELSKPGISSVPQKTLWRPNIGTETQINCSYEKERVIARILKRSTSCFLKHEEGQRIREKRARNGEEGPSCRG